MSEKYIIVSPPVGIQVLPKTDGVHLNLPAGNGTSRRKKKRAIPKKQEMGGRCLLHLFKTEAPGRVKVCFYRPKMPVGEESGRKILVVEDASRETLVGEDGW